MLAACLLVARRNVAQGGGAYLVKDIDDTPVTASTDPTGFAEVNERHLIRVGDATKTAQRLG